MLRPYETKAIARAVFFGVSVTNHTSFVRVKTNHSSSPSVVLPVEVEVSDGPGLFLSRELLDFGVVKSGGECVCLCDISNKVHTFECTYTYSCWAIDKYEVLFMQRVEGIWNMFMLCTHRQVSNSYYCNM